MVCGKCAKAITVDDLVREERTAYVGGGVHREVEYYYCPNCGDGVYPTYDDWLEAWVKSQQ